MSEVSKNFAREDFPEYKDYFDLQKEKDSIQFHIQSENKKFSNSLKEGGKRLEEIMKQPLSMGKFIPPKTLWNLYSTYGFPMDLTRLIAREKGWLSAGEKGG